ncbi:uncharacterized protein LOC127523010 isoform X3 [Ctenopharyngodon idella]|uniref:uncharacterized protein LOC127523010 isoform X3 n=1 Tax=Ctenopharyngodon idella TaxID=7959 RepID=UPI00222EE94E|nr:uncharacterized protein LOC127523010 isoform X3 [Ctenopharyngodon idella]
MPGSTLKMCRSCNVHISVACKTCKHCGQKQDMKKAVKLSKQKINDKWVKNMKGGNNFCKLLNSANVLIHKMHALGRYPLLLLGKRNVFGTFSTDVITANSFLSPEEVSIDTIKNIFTSLLKVKYSAQDSGVETCIQSMSSSEEDRGASNKGDDLSGSTGEDVVTLFLTPVDLSCEPSHKKRILEKSKGPEDSVQASASAPNALHLPISKLITGPEDSVQASASASNALHLPISKLITGPEDSVQASASAPNALHLPVSKLITGPEDSVQASASAPNALHLPISKLIIGPEDSVQASASAPNALHLPISKLITGPEDSVQASASAPNALHLPISKLITGPEDSVQASASAPNALHLPVSKLITGPEDSVQASASAHNALHLPVSKLKKFNYKIKDCPVHLNKEDFPFVKTMGTRISRNGKKETKVRWQPCSGCGVKWKDTWEPYELFHSVE